MSIFQSIAFPLSAELRGSTALSGTCRRHGKLIAWLVVASALGVGFAHADGGQASGTVATGGTNQNTAAGGTGGDGGVFGGGAGGGAGVTGGAGGLGDGQVTRAAGGAVAGSSGANGADGSGGNGGGGGAHGYVGAAAPVGNLTGGNGGNGGNATTYDGGGGGAGGYGAVVTGGGGLAITGIITGGSGGNGGTGFNGGSGGSGGHGVVFLSNPDVTVTGNVYGGNGGAGRPISSAFESKGGDGGHGLILNGGTVTNSGSIIGGNGAFGALTNGAGGNGILGSNIVVINSGTIVGSPGGGGAQASAIRFTSGTNVLELRSGSSISGNVEAGGTTDTLRLGGTTNSIFNVSEIGAAEQYQGFEAFTKTGTSTWTLAGTSTEVTPWRISQGTLAIAADGALGATSGALTFDGGTLATTANFSSSRTMTFTSTGQFSVATGTTLLLSGTLNGSAGLTKTGAGTLTVTAANSYLGGTTVSTGALLLSGAGTLGAGAVTVSNGAILRLVGVSATNAISISGNGTGNGVIIANSGANSLSGTVTLAASSTISVDLGATLSLNGTTAVSGSNNSLTLQGQGTGSVGAMSLGTGGLTKFGTGAWTLTAANTYSGGTTISEGMLVLSNSGSMGTGSANVASGATLALSFASVSNAITISGTGSSGEGAILGFTGSSTYSGTISLAADATIGVRGGWSLSLTGATSVSGTNRTLTLVGQGTGSVGAMSLGTGSLVKEDLGTWTLTAASTYSGGTAINSGTLRVQNNGSLGSGNIIFNGGTLAAGANVTLANNVTLNGAGFVDAATNALHLSGNISGVTALTFSSTGGLGTVFLSGDNNGHSGTTSVNANVLLTARSTTAFSASSDYTTASGGALFLAGYSNTVRSLSGAGSVSNNNTTAATLTIAPLAGLITFSGIIEDGAGGGAFSLIKTGAGAQVLTGANTFTGSTTINGGRLTLSGAGSLASPTIIVNPGAQLETDGVTGGGGLTIASAVTLNGNGMLTVSGAETIGSVAGSGVIRLFADLRTGGDNTNTTFSGSASNSGGLTKDGTGRMTLSGTNFYSGVTTVNDGVLEVATGGVIASATTVTGGGFVVNGTAQGVTLNGGFLGGVGTVGATIVNAGGTLAPGNSIGTLNVSGNLGFAAGATFAVEVSPTTADLVNVSGTATLGNATVVTTYAPGQYIQRQYTIVNATGGIVGTFSGVTGTVPTGFTQSLAYDGNNAYLVLTLLMSPGGGGGQGGGLGPYGNLDANQLAVAQAITAAFLANGGIDARFGALDANGLTQVSGQTSTAAAGAGLQAAGQFLDAMGDPSISSGNSAPSGDASNAYAPLAYAAEPATLSSPGALAALGVQVPASSDAANATLAMSSARAADPAEAALATRWKMWGTVYGNVGQIRGNATLGSVDLTARNWGIASGFDRSFGDSRLGLSLGGAGSTFTLGNGLGSGSAGIFNAGIYGSHNFGNAYISGALGYGWNSVRTTRNVPGDTLTASFNAHTLAGRIEGGYRWGGATAIAPYIAVQGASYFLPAYTETSVAGGPFALAYGRQSEAALRSELGARFEHSMPTSTGSLKFSARAAWAYNAVNERAVTAAFASLPGQTFTTNGARPARHSALIDLGVEASFDSGLSAKVNFSGEFSRNVSAYGASAKLIYRW